MKILLIAAALFITSQGFANQDHEAGMEAVPNETRLEATRLCFEELEHAGCGQPADREHFHKCALDTVKSLDPNCQKLVEKLYK